MSINEDFLINWQILFFLSIPFILALTYIMFWIIIYHINKSKIKFDLNKECEIDFNQKYDELKIEHNYFVLKNLHSTIRAISIVGSLIIIAFFISVKIGVILFIITYIILLLYHIEKIKSDKLKNSLQNEKEDLMTQRNNLIKKYYDIIIKDLILKRFNGKIKKRIDYSLLENVENYEEFEKKYDVVLKQEQKTNAFFSLLFKKMHKIVFKNFDIDFCISFEINGKDVEISRFKNYTENLHKKRGYWEIYSFDGYLIKITNFTDYDKLDRLNKKDYYYDAEDNVLYICISDQIKSGVIKNKSGVIKDISRFKPNFYIKFEKTNFLKKNYIYFDEMYKFIEKMI